MLMGKIDKQDDIERIVVKYKAATVKASFGLELPPCRNWLRGPFA